MMLHVHALALIDCEPHGALKEAARQQQKIRERHLSPTPSRSRCRDTERGSHCGTGNATTERATWQTPFSPRGIVRPRMSHYNQTYVFFEAPQSGSSAKRPSMYASPPRSPAHHQPQHRSQPLLLPPYFPVVQLHTPVSHHAPTSLKCNGDYGPQLGEGDGARARCQRKV
jgi:hypothetical protein